jgi:glucose-1-phosphate adenylyltransferase
MWKKEYIAMLLAGGQGNRLGILTKNLAKPAVPFGGKYRIIDFALSNCTNSGIDTVGVLTQYRPHKLNAYIGTGQPWDLDIIDGGVFVLPPYVKGKRGEWYKGTANAIYQNIEFIEQYDPKYIIILSGDHIYKMDYSIMLEYHKQKNAAATIAVIKVPCEEASRFGIMDTDEYGRITEFTEKPKLPKSNNASMGIYIFDWKMLKEYLIEDDKDVKSIHDFGKNIIPRLLENGEKVYAYYFSGYWKDVGTIQSLWEANMDLLESVPAFDLYDPKWRIYARNPGEPPHYISQEAEVINSIIAEGSRIYGSIEHSVIFSSVEADKGCCIKDSVIMPRVSIGKNTRLSRVIVGEGARIGENCSIGFGDDVANKYYPDIYNTGITVIGEDTVIPDGTIIGRNVVVVQSPVNVQMIPSGECVRMEEEI